MQKKIILIAAGILILLVLIFRDGNKNLEISVSSFPTIEEFKEYLKSYPESEDHTEILMAATGPLLQIYELGKMDAAFEAKAFGFFKSCAESSDFINPVRAFCYKKYQALMQVTKNSEYSALPKIDAGVEKLVKKF